MNDEARRASAIALTELARSRDYRDRADAGRGLASLAERPEACGMLLKLILDKGDTFVTLATTEALLRRKDAVGFAVVASALAIADPSHGDWIHTAVMDVFGVFSRDRDAAVRGCETLSRDPDERVRRGAEQLAEMLTEIEPAFHTMSND